MQPLQLSGRLLRRWATYAEDAAVFLVGLTVLYLLGRVVLLPVARRALAYRGIDPKYRGAAYDLLRFAILVAAVVVAATLAGFGHVFARSAIVVAALTVALGFATQDVVGNLVSGVFIIADPGLNVGDWIEWDGEEGVVRDIGLRTTRVRTFDGEVVNVPNATLTGTEVTNAVITDRLRIRVPVTLGFDADLDAATAIFLAASRRHPDVLDDPEPAVRVTGFGDEGLDVEARLWIADPARADFVRIRSEYVRDVAERFATAGVEVSPDELELSGAVRTGGEPVGRRAGE